MNKIKKIIFRNLINALGWRTNRKLLVIESDDWGSLRMSSKKSLETLKKHIESIDSDPFCRLDALEQSEDFLRLYEILDKNRNVNNNPPIITTNTIMSNPDFPKIQESNFQHYQSIKLEESYNRYSDGASAITALWYGINNRYIKPQFHGREHLNIPLWMEALQSNDKTTLLAFDEHIFGLKTKFKKGTKKNHMAAYETCKLNNEHQIATSVLEGLSFFETYFKYPSKTLIAPSYIWDAHMEKISNKAGVEGFQGIPYQYKPTNGLLKREMHFTGERNKFNQIYLVRNVFFEPSIEPSKDVVNECLRRINNAFKWRKPAIIGTHRINFIGSMDERNRDKNLKLFDILLKKILKTWPDVEFISSEQLSSIIKSEGYK